MWTIVYLANSTDLKNSICTLLDGKGIIYKVHPIVPTQEDMGMCYNVLVPASEVNLAHALILDEEL